MRAAGVSRWLICCGLFFALPAALSGQSLRNEYILMLFYDPLAGHESEFESWWPTYLRDVAAVPGVTSAEDFRRASVRLRDGSQPLPAHLAYVSVFAADFGAVIRDIDQRMTSGRIKISPAVNMQAFRSMSYHQDGVWTHQPPAIRGHIFLQIVLANPTPGQEAEYDRWFAQNHGPQLASVPGVYEIDRGVRSNVTPIPGNAALPPLYLSAMRFETRAILAFKEDLEQAAKSYITPTTSYDLEHAWRETYQRTGSLLRGAARR
jgi:hypothetical protein